MREVGKILGLTDDVTGALSTQVWGWSEEGVEEKTRRSPETSTSKTAASAWR